MRILDIITGIAALVASIGILILFFVNEWYAMIAIVVFFVCNTVYRWWKRRHDASEQNAAAAWHKRVK